MSKTGLYIGRFQPFHLGHLSVIKRALKQVDFLIIGIGSAQYHHQEKNPFTIEERKKMIELSLVEAKVEQNLYTIIPLPDIHDNEKWPTYVEKMTPPFEKVFVGDNGIVKELFEKKTDKKVEIIEEEVPIRATKIRKEISEGGNGEEYLSNAVARYLEGVEGIERIKELGL